MLSFSLFLAVSRRHLCYVLERKDVAPSLQSREVEKEDEEEEEEGEPEANYALYDLQL